MDNTQAKLAFDKTSHISNFDEYRVLSPRIISKWIDIISYEFIASKCTSDTLLDVGAGTGRFSLPFAKANPNLKVVALDKSKEMLEKLESKAEYSELLNIQTFLADVENFSHEIKFAIAFFSEMLHLLSDLNKSFHNIYEHLIDGGKCCIRTVSHKQLSNVEWIKFFNGALEIDIRRTYDVPEIVNTLKNIGFSDIKISNIDECSIFKSDFYEKMLRNKVYSLLHILDNSILQEGYEKISDYCKNKMYCPHTMELTCIIARK
jgi:FkbM family methyltransferase